MEGMKIGYAHPHPYIPCFDQMFKKSYPLVFFGRNIHPAIFMF